VIIPVQDFQRKYGDRIAVLGGLNINPNNAVRKNTPPCLYRNFKVLAKTKK